MGNVLESQAWLRLSNETGHQLPANIAEAIVEANRIDALIKETPRAVPVPRDSELRARGITDDALPAERRRLKAEHEAAVQARTDLEAAKATSRQRIAHRVKAAREDLILGLRPFFDALVAKARPIVLAGHHDEAAVLRSGDGKALKALQSLMEMERQFGHAMAAWRASFQAMVVRCDGSMHPGEVNEGYVYFARPDLVRDDSLAGRARNRMGRPIHPAPTLASLAAEAPEATFRPALITELEAVYERLAPVARAAHKPVTVVQA